jgi:PadR family transcriptional regulator AphA
MRVKHDLLAGEWAVLALLCEEPRHGYAIAGLMAPDGEVGRVWSLRRPMTYRALASLQKLGLAEVHAVEAGETAPNRTLMRATPDAQARVAEWLTEAEPHVRDLRSLLLLKIVFLRRRGRPLEPLLEAQRERLAEQLHSLSEQPAGGDDLTPVLARWRCSMTGAALTFVDDVLEEERRTAAPAPPRRPARAAHPGS